MHNHYWVFITSLAVIFLTSCSSRKSNTVDLINNSFPEAQAELQEVIKSLAEDIENDNIKGLKAGHLVSEKFTKFGPRNFERQDVASTNKTESAHFGSTSNFKYEIKDLKIDVFGDVGIVTYYPLVSFVQDGVLKSGSGRQTLIYVNTVEGWKIVHEHGTAKE